MSSILTGLIATRSGPEIHLGFLRRSLRQATSWRRKHPILRSWRLPKRIADHPDARLRMVGNGPLLSPCQDLAEALGLQHAITFLGEQPHEVIQAEMRNARCFVQHSIMAQDGNSEGLPNVILEAGASGLPVVSTRHAGIVDAVIEGETGLLVDEKDIAGMAVHQRHW